MSGGRCRFLPFGIMFFVPMCSLGWPCSYDVCTLSIAAFSINSWRLPVRPKAFALATAWVTSDCAYDIWRPSVLAVRIDIDCVLNAVVPLIMWPALMGFKLTGVLYSCVREKISIHLTEIRLELCAPFCCRLHQVWSNVDIGVAKRLSCVDCRTRDLAFAQSIPSLMIDQ